MITLNEYIEIRQGSTPDQPGVHVIPRKKYVLDEIAVPTASGTIMIRIQQNRAAGDRVLEARIGKQRNWRVSPRIKSGTEWGDNSTEQVARAIAGAIQMPVQRVSNMQPDGWIISMGHEIFRDHGERLHSELQRMLRDSWKSNNDQDMPRRSTMRDLLFWRRMLRQEQVFTGLAYSEDPGTAGINTDIPTSFGDYEPSGSNHSDKRNQR